MTERLNPEVPVVVQRKPSLLSVLTGPLDVSPVQDGIPVVGKDLYVGGKDRDLEKGDETSKTVTEDRHSDDNDQKSNKNHETQPELIVVDWDGPDDPMDPRNWSSFKKWSAMTGVGLMCFVSPLASTLIAPAAQTIADDPDFMITNPTITALLVSIFILGYAFGPLIASPMSELYGRNMVMQIFMGIFFIFNVACAVAKSPTQMIVFRFLAGVGGAAPLTVGGGVLADMFLPHERGLAMSLFSLTTLFGPVVGPVAGGFIVENIQWRWCLWLLVIVSGVTLLLSPFILAETYHPVLLRQKAARIRKETGNPNVMTEYEMADGKKTPKQIVMENLSRPFALLFTNPACFLIGAYMAICYGYLYLMYTTFETVFTERYHESLSISGLNYLSPGLGNFFGCFVCAVTMDRVYVYLSRRNGGNGIPEYRVPIMLVASIFMPIGLIIYGWSAEKRVMWFWPDLGVFIFTTSALITFLVQNTYIVDSFKYAASALAATTVLRSLAGALFPLFGNVMFQSKLGLGWGNTLLAALALILGTAYPIFLWHYGPKLRAKSNTDR